ncbi:unnamed protein product [Dovyalis caffra]|uniref:Uncharacterized protein n=1 Tax=Dovyalis caffra TaxID=77055 RepID=A0AAV1SEA2_9ROSI|nr:unnamed protein product [Dovyalis caffra]
MNVFNIRRIRREDTVDVSRKVKDSSIARAVNDDFGDPVEDDKYLEVFQSLSRALQLKKPN